MAATLKAGFFFQSKPGGHSLQRVKPLKFKPPMATLAAVPTVGLSDTFSKLKRQGKVAFIPYITAGDPDLSTTAQALKVLDSCGSDIIELGVPYSDPLADGPVIQAAATRSLARGTNFDKIIAMLKDVVPQLSCPIALFSYYNPILKRGVETFMTTLKDAGIHGLVVPDIPLEETGILRKEAVNNNVELVLLTTPTTPIPRMKAIVEASEGFVYLVSSVGVTGARTSVSDKVQSLLHEIKEATSKPVAVGFGISTPEHVKQVAGWGADGVIVGSAMVKVLGEAKSPEEGLKELENFTKSLKVALAPWNHPNQTRLDHTQLPSSPPLPTTSRTKCTPRPQAPSVVVETLSPTPPPTNTPITTGPLHILRNHCHHLQNINNHSKTIAKQQIM